MDVAAKNENKIEPFRVHYEEDASQWGKGSGAGSNPYHTIEYRCFVDKFIRMNNVSSVTDIGCGDWQFSKFINFDGIRYTGLDVVSSVIERNTREFSRPNLNFSLMPNDWSAIQPADLLLMKDVLQHLSDEDIYLFRDAVFPKFKRCLITNSYRKLNTAINVNIRTGDFRCLDLSEAPYFFKGSYVLEFSSPLWERIRTFLYTGA